MRLMLWATSLLLLGLAGPAAGAPSGGKPGAAAKENRWPRDPRLLLERLNRWDKDELDVVETPAAHRGRVASGETGGWVSSHKAELHALGYAVKWERAKRRYVLAAGAAEDWVEKDRTAYLGRYESVFEDSSAEDRAAGRGGSGVKVRAWIELGQAGGHLTARYGVGPAKAGASRDTTATLSDVRLESNQIATSPINVKTAWPYYLPALFEGRFVKPQSLVFSGRLYRRVAGPPARPRSARP